LGVLRSLLEEVEGKTCLKTERGEILERQAREESAKHKERERERERSKRLSRKRSKREDSETGAAAALTDTEEDNARELSERFTRRKLGLDLNFKDADLVPLEDQHGWSYASIHRAAAADAWATLTSP